MYQIILNLDEENKWSLDIKDRDYIRTLGIFSRDMQRDDQTSGKSAFYHRNFVTGNFQLFVTVVTKIQ